MPWASPDMGNVTENKIIQLIQLINALKDKGGEGEVLYIY